MSILCLCDNRFLLVKVLSFCSCCCMEYYVVDLELQTAFHLSTIHVRLGSTDLKNCIHLLTTFIIYWHDQSFFNLLHPPNLSYPSAYLRLVLMCGNICFCLVSDHRNLSELKLSVGFFHHIATWYYCHALFGLR